MKKLPSITHRQTLCWVQLSSSSKLAESLCSKSLCECEPLIIIRAFTFWEDTSPSPSSFSWQSTRLNLSGQLGVRADCSVTVVNTRQTPVTLTTVTESGLPFRGNPRDPDTPRPGLGQIPPNSFVLSPSPLPALLQLSVCCSLRDQSQARSQSRRQSWVIPRWPGKIGAPSPLFTGWQVNRHTQSSPGK